MPYDNIWSLFRDWGPALATLLALMLASIIYFAKKADCLQDRLVESLGQYSEKYAALVRETTRAITEIAEAMDELSDIILEATDARARRTKERRERSSARRE